MYTFCCLERSAIMLSLVISSYLCVALSVNHKKIKATLRTNISDEGMNSFNYFESMQKRTNLAETNYESRRSKTTDLISNVTAVKPENVLINPNHPSILVNRRLDTFPIVRNIARSEEQKSSSLKTSDSTIKFNKYEIGDTINLNCRMPTGPYLVMWDKVGLGYPLTIGSQRFTPDTRFSARFKSPDHWQLTVNKARAEDSGLYTCTTSSGKRIQRTNKNDNRSRQNNHHRFFSSESTIAYQNGFGFKTNENLREKNGRNKISNVKKTKDYYEYYVTVVEPSPSERFQVDAPASDQESRRNKTITVTGPKLVFYGTPLELVCRASFPTAEAKRNPHISLEWYHRGIRRQPSATRSGGVYISERWLDSHLLESRLFVSWAGESDAGQWICLDRSKPSSANGLLMFNHNQNASSIRLDPFQLRKSQVRPTGMNDHLVYDRIEVEIIDLPDPTEYPLHRILSTPLSIPAVSGSENVPTRKKLRYGYNQLYFHDKRSVARGKLKRLAGVSGSREPVGSTAGLPKTYTNVILSLSTFLHVILILQKI